MEHLPVSTLQLRRHAQSDLVDRVVEISKREESNQSSLQRTALERYRTGSIFWNSMEEEYEEIEVLNAWLNLVDDLFFGQSLTAYCTIKLMSKKPRQNKNRVILGQCSVSSKRKFPSGNLHSIKCVIEIWTDPDIDNEHDQRLSRLGILVHEMIHAYFRIYACHWRPCYTLSYALESEGKTGHGFAWQDIAFAISIAAADPSYLGTHLQLGRIESLAKELNAPKQDANVDLSRWGLSSEEI